MTTPYIDPNLIFAENAPTQDKPAAFENYDKGWDESRKNDGRPSIKQMNYLQQQADLKNLYIHENGAALPYKEGVAYEENAVVVKDGVLQQWKGGAWKSVIADGLSDTIQTFNTPETGVDPVTGVADGAYYNVRSTEDDSYLVEYQNIGGVPTPSGKSYPSGSAIDGLKEAIIDPDTGLPSASKIKDASGKSQQELNDLDVILPNVAALRALPASRVSEIKSVTLLGYYTAGDGGAGPRRVWRSGPYSDNGGSIIVANGGGAWVWEDENCDHNLRWWGAKGDGVTDDSLAIINALVWGGNVSGNPGDTYLYKQIVVSSNPAVTEKWPNSYKSKNTKPFNFNGNGCKFKAYGFVGETPPPQIAATLMPNQTASNAVGGSFFIGGLDHFKLSNFFFTGSLFDNPDEDSKPYIAGVQGTLYAYNTRAKGIQIYDCEDFDLEKINGTASYELISLYGTRDARQTDINIAYVERGFVQEKTIGTVSKRCKVYAARYQLAGTNRGIYRLALPVVDASGTKLYDVVPSPTGSDGAKGGSGISFLDLGTTNSKFYNCESDYALSNSFRVQDDADNLPSSGAEYIDCVSDYCSRHAFSIYGPVVGRVKVVRPIIKHHGELKIIVDPPATREEALLGTQGTDIRDYWMFHTLTDEQQLGFSSGHDGFEIIDPTYETSDDITYTRGRYAIKRPTDIVRRVGSDITSSNGDIYKGGYYKSAVYRSDARAWLLIGSVEGATWDVIDRTTAQFILLDNTSKTKTIEFNNSTINVLGSNTQALSLLRFPTGGNKLPASAKMPDWEFKNLTLNVEGNRTSIYAVNEFETDGEAYSCVFSQCNLPKNAGVLTFGGYKSAQILNDRCKNLIAPDLSASVRRDTVRKLYQISEFGRLSLRLHISNTLPIYAYVPKRARLASVTPATSSGYDITGGVPQDHLSITNAYLPQVVVDGAKQLTKTYTAAGVAGGISVTVEAVEGDELYLKFESSNAIEGHYVFTFDMPSDFDYVAAINSKKT